MQNVKRPWLGTLIALPLLLSAAACDKTQQAPQPGFSSIAPATAPAAKPKLKAASRKKAVVKTSQSDAAGPAAVEAAQPVKSKQAKPAKTEPVTEDVSASEPSSAVATVAAAVEAPTASAPETPETAELAVATKDEKSAVKAWAVETAKELARICPMGDPADQAAMEACKQHMYRDSALRKALAPITLWGRQSKDPKKPLRETNLTQFSPDVLAGLYMPLFMFNGTSKVAWSESEKLYRVELGVAFRNRLLPGEFPYPFWHDDEKWATYQSANAMLLWIAPKSHEVRVAQFSTRGTPDGSVVIVPVEQAAFDGKWMWTDENGVTQPKVTLFDGLYRADNPYIGKLDASYKLLALSLRDGNCSVCHAPNNPSKMKRLVLLQTPAHAAGEIKRLIKAVEGDRMPLDPATGIGKPLASGVKAELLERATAFDALVEQAKAWEASHALQSASASGSTEPAGP